MEITNNLIKYHLEKPVSMGEIFLRQADRLQDRICVSCKRNNAYLDFSWNEMKKMVHNLASYMDYLNILPNDNIAIFSENCPEWWVSDLAINLNNGVLVPIYATNSAEETKFILNHSDSKICIVSSEENLKKILKIKNELQNLSKIIVLSNVIVEDQDVISFKDALELGAKHTGAVDFEAKIKSSAPDNLATIIYTSGTTGNPKGVMLSNRNLTSNLRQVISEMDNYITDNDLFLSFLPLSHAFERTVGYYLPMAVGAKVVFAEDIRKVVDNMKEVRPTFMVSVPRLYEKIHEAILSQVKNSSKIKKIIFAMSMKVAAKNMSFVCNELPRKGFFKLKYRFFEKVIFSKLKEAIGMDRMSITVSGGAPLAISDSEFFIGMGIRIIEGFGLTETSPITNVNKPWEIKIGTVGPPLPDTEVRISDEGELQIKGPQVMMGYYKDDEATKNSMTEDGFFKTGDLAILDELGNISITGRIKDIIITAGGKNISPQNIEGSLKKSLYIEQVAVFGDRKKFLSALIVPSFEHLEKWAEELNIDFDTRKQLINNEKVLEMIKNEIEDLTKSLARVEKIKKFILLENEWTQESGELTPSMKVKRKVVQKNFAIELENFYL